MFTFVSCGWLTIWSTSLFLLFKFSLLLLMLVMETFIAVLLKTSLLKDPITAEYFFIAKSSIFLFAYIHFKYLETC